MSVKCTVPTLKGVFGLVKERNVNTKITEINMQLQAVVSARQEAPRMCDRDGETCPSPGSLVNIPRGSEFPVGA